MSWRSCLEIPARSQRRTTRAGRRVSIRRAVVIGSTAWGTTLSVLLARNGLDVTMLTRTTAEAAELEAARAHPRRLPGIAFPAALHASADPAALEVADLVIVEIGRAHV